MKLVGTYISFDCARKCLLYVDKNGYYHIMRYELGMPVRKGKEDYKHIESARRAIAKWNI